MCLFPVMGSSDSKQSIYATLDRSRGESGGFFVVPFWYHMESNRRHPKSSGDISLEAWAVVFPDRTQKNYRLFEFCPRYFLEIVKTWATKKNLNTKIHFLRNDLVKYIVVGDVPDENLLEFNPAKLYDG